MWRLRTGHHPGQGWHFHAHILASRMAWWDQADLAASWAEISGDVGRIVDIRAVKDLQKGIAETLKYVMKPTNLLDWGPEQVRQYLCRSQSPSMPLRSLGTRKGTHDIPVQDVVAVS
jgi:hypothetical protein